MRKEVIPVELEAFSESRLPNGDTVVMYRENHFGHVIAIVTNERNETVAVSFR